MKLDILVRISSASGYAHINTCRSSAVVYVHSNHVLNTCRSSAGVYTHSY